MKRRRCQISGVERERQVCPVLHIWHLLLCSPPSAAFQCARLLEEDPLLLEEDEEEEEDEVPSRSQPRAAMSSATAARSGRWRRSASSQRALILGRLRGSYAVTRLLHKGGIRYEGR